MVFHTVTISAVIGTADFVERVIPACFPLVEAVDFEPGFRLHKFFVYMNKERDVSARGNGAHDQGSECGSKCDHAGEHYSEVGQQMMNEICGLTFFLFGFYFASNREIMYLVSAVW